MGSLGNSASHDASGITHMLHSASSVGAPLFCTSPPFPCGASSSRASPCRFGVRVGQARDLGCNIQEILSESHMCDSLSADSQSFWGTEFYILFYFHDFLFEWLHVDTRLQTLCWAAQLHHILPYPMVWICYLWSFPCWCTFRLFSHLLQQIKFQGTFKITRNVETNIVSCILCWHTVLCW